MITCKKENKPTDTCKTGNDDGTPRDDTFLKSANSR